MSINPAGSGADSHSWNYSRPNDPGFALALTGTVGSIQEVQALKFGPNGKPSGPKFWDDGNPVMSIRISLVGPSGGYRTFIFQPAGKAAREGKKKSIHLDLFALTGNTDMHNLVGKTIEIATEAPPMGFSYGMGNPRPWTVRLVEEGPYTAVPPLPPELFVDKLLADQAVSGGQVVPQPQAAPAQQPVMAAQPMPQQQMAPQVAQPMAQPVMQQPVAQVPSEDFYEDLPF